MASLLCGGRVKLGLRSYRDQPDISAAFRKARAHSSSPSPTHIAATLMGAAALDPLDVSASRLSDSQGGMAASGSLGCRKNRQYARCACERL